MFIEAILSCNCESRCLETVLLQTMSEMTTDFQGHKKTWLCTRKAMTTAQSGQKNNKWLMLHPERDTLPLSSTCAENPIAGEQVKFFCKGRSIGEVFLKLHYLQGIQIEPQGDNLFLKMKNLMLLIVTAIALTESLKRSCLKLFAKPHCWWSTMKRAATQETMVFSSIPVQFKFKGETDCGKQREQK